MNKKIIYACLAMLGLMTYSCSVDPLEKDSKPLNATDALKAGGFSKGKDSLKVKAFNQEMMESADNIEKHVDKGKK